LLVGALNMAAFNTARRLFDLLTIPVPILLIGLLPDESVGT